MDISKNVARKSGHPSSKSFELQLENGSKKFVGDIPDPPGYAFGLILKDFYIGIQTKIFRDALTSISPKPSCSLDKDNLSRLFHCVFSHSKISKKN